MTAKWLLALLACVSMASTATAAPSAGPAAQPRSYWNVWVAKDGTTHQSTCEIRDFSPLSLGPGVQSIYVDKGVRKPSSVWIAQFPAGWVGSWHENPKPQWIIPLSGRWFVETTDGHRVEMGPGNMSFGGDQGSTPNKLGRSGHLSGTLGNEPVTLMFVQMPPTAHASDVCPAE